MKWGEDERAPIFSGDGTFRPLARLVAVMKLAALAFAIVLSAGAAPAPPELSQAFGNTVVSTYPDGRTGLLWLKRDGTYDAKGRRRTPSSGTWAVKGGKVCLKQLKPMRAPFSYCTRLPSGESWKAKAVTGEPITVRVVRGVAVP